MASRGVEAAQQGETTPVLTGRILVLLFVTAVAVNYPWELTQAPLYRWAGESRNALWHCFVAALGDGVLVLLIYAIGLIIFRRRDWFEKPNPTGYIVMLTTGLSVAIAVEWLAVHVAGRWEYSDAMPKIPGLDVGVVPIVQMLILPPLILHAVAAIAKRFR